MPCPACQAHHCPEKPWGRVKQQHNGRELRKDFCLKHVRWCLRFAAGTQVIARYPLTCPVCKRVAALDIDTGECDSCTDGLEEAELGGVEDGALSSPG